MTSAFCDSGGGGGEAGRWLGSGFEDRQLGGESIRRDFKNENQVRVLDAIHSFHKHFLLTPPKYLGFRDARFRLCLPGVQSVGEVATLNLSQLFAESTQISGWAGKAEMKKRSCGVVVRGVRTAAECTREPSLLKANPLWL